jgi:hypothetical protein
MEKPRIKKLFCIFFNSQSTKNLLREKEQVLKSTLFDQILVVNSFAKRIRIYYRLLRMGI